MLDVVISGFCGAVSSIFGKIAFSSAPLVEYLIYTCEINLPNLTNENCTHLSYVFRFGCLLIMLYGNALMFSLFMKALETKGSLPVTVVSSGTNFLVTGIVSGIVLGERVNTRWYIGAGVIAVGVCLIALSQHSKKD